MHTQYHTCYTISYPYTKPSVLRFVNLNNSSKEITSKKFRGRATPKERQSAYFFLKYILKNVNVINLKILMKYIFI